MPSGFTVVVDKKKAQREQRKLELLEEALKKKLLSIPESAIYVDDDMSYEQLLEVEKRYVPFHLQEKIGAAKKVPQQKKKIKEKEKKYNIYGDTDEDSEQEQEENESNDQEEQNVPNNTKAPKRENLLNSKIVRKTANTKETIDETIERVLNSCPGHKCAYSVFVQRFKDFSRHGWTPQHKAKFGSLIDYINSTEKYVVSDNTVYKQDGTIVPSVPVKKTKRSLPSSDVSHSNVTNNVGTTPVQRSTIKNSSKPNKTSHSDKTRVSSHFDDGDEDDAKNRGCAPDAVNWGLRIPVVFFTFLFLAFMGLSILITTKTIPQEIIDNNTFLTAFAGFLHDLQHDF